MVEDCIFCKIINREKSAFSLAENDHAFAFLDNFPCVPGHTLVVSKFHSSSFTGLPEGEIAKIFELVHQVANKINDTLKPDGLTIGINQGPGSHQGVPHLHVHILPRYLNDGGGSIHTIVQTPSEGSLEEMVEKLKIN